MPRTRKLVINQDGVQLHRHQTNALCAIHNHLGSRYVCHMFCGTGKTLTYITRLTHEMLAAGLGWFGIVVVPWLDLVRQLARDYKNNLDMFGQVMCFCSDGDLATEGRANTADLGMESTTDEELLRSFLGGGNSRLLLVTYQSFVKATDVLLDTQTRVNHIIFDEAHHTAPAVDDSALRLRVHECPELDALCKKIGFWTATVRKTSQIDMTDLERCGPVLLRYTYAEAVADNIVLPFELQVGLCTDHSEYDARQTLVQYFEWLTRLCLANADREFFNILEYKGRVNSQEGEDGDAVGEVKTFATKANEDLFRRIFLNICETEYPQHKDRFRNFRIIGYYGEQATDVRAQLRTEFNQAVPGRICILSSCQTLKEGVDMPEANMVVLAKGSGSVEALTQIIGRVVRKSKKFHRTHTPIVALPVMISPEHLDELDDEEERSERLGEMMRQGKEFSTTMALIAWLQTEENDPELLEHVLRYPHKYSPAEREKSLTDQGMEIQPTLHPTLADAVGAPAEAETPEEVAKAIGKDIELHTQSLEEPIEMVRCGVEGAPLVRVMKYDDGDEEVEGGYKVVQSKKKSAAKRPKPRPFSFRPTGDKEIDIRWNLKDGYDLVQGFGAAVVESQLEWNELRWGKKYEKLVAFVSDHNGQLPSQKAEDPEEKRLGQWVSDQRKAFKKEQLDAERIQRLEAMDGWIWDTLAATWAKTLVEVAEFIAEHERQPQKEAKNLEEQRLGRWVCAQRAAKKGQLDAERIQRLEATPGWNWDGRADAWTRILVKVIKFVDNHDGRLPPSSGEDPKEKKLGRWIDMQRTAYRKELLETERIRQLETIPGWTWDPHADTWNTTIIELIDFVSEPNNQLPSQKAKDPEDRKLGRWVSTQRRAKKKGELDAERIQRLEAIPGWTWVGQMGPRRSAASAPASPPRTNVTTNMVRPASSGVGGSTRSRHQSELSKIHKQYKNTSAANLNKKFGKDPALFKKYHEVAKANDAEWEPSELPVAKTVKRLMQEAEVCKRTGKQRRVADLGCGMAELAAAMAGMAEIQVDGYDHVAAVDGVTACNIADVDKPDWYDTVVLSRVLGWGREGDTEGYLKKAHEMLDRGGELIIHEGNRKWWDAEKQECRLIGMLEKCGFIIVERTGVATSNEAPIYMEVRALKV